MKIRKLERQEHGNTRPLYETVFTEDSKSFVDYYYTEKTRDNQIYVSGRRWRDPRHAPFESLHADGQRSQKRGKLYRCGGNAERISRKALHGEAS